MRERARGRRDAERPDEARREQPAPVPPLARVLALQRSAGNRAVAGMLTRHGDHGDHDHAPEAGGGPATGTPPVLTPAVQEAEALATWGLLRSVHQQMLNHTDVRIRNTGQMLDPPAERPQGGRMSVKPMTLRSDSARLVADRGGNPAQDAYYFYGSRQDNEHRHGPRTIGTIEGESTVLVRGKLAGGTWQTHENIMGTLVHEGSHILVKDYGEHPATAGDAGSFDRYRDEFRAYFVEPHGGFDHIADPDAKAAAIKTHLVGTNATTGGYPHLRAAYWAGPAATNPFRRQVDAHTRPDGFNLANSPRLDRLVQLLRDQRGGRATVEDSVFQIMVLEPAERQEAAGATLVATLLGRLPAAEAQRIRRALTSPAAVAYGRELNPNESPRVTAFLDAVTAKAPDQIVDAYRNCPAADRGTLAHNAGLLAWIGRVLPNELLTRTCAICMVAGGSFVYFERVRAFAQACGAAAGATETPEALRTALRGLSLEVRLAYYRFCEDAYRAHVEPLADPVKRDVRAILRGERDA
jgi:hypothetical protein